MDSMWFLILGHFLGDYAFQSDRMAEKKVENSGPLVIHALIYALTVAAVYYCGLLLTGRGISSTLLFILAFAGIFVVHGLQDLVKARMFSCSRQAYYLDQGLHVIQIFVIRLWLG